MKMYSYLRKLTYFTVVILMFLVVNFQAMAQVSWPESQILPSFSAPSTNLDFIDLMTLTSGEQNLFVTLQGIINKQEPRIYIHQIRDNKQNEGKYTWLNDLSLGYTEVGDPYSLIMKYKSEITGIIVYDENQPDTINLATSIGSLEDAIICSEAEVAKLTAAPYNLPIIKDLRDMFNSRLEVYKYLYNNYWSQLSHRAIAIYNCGPTVHNGIEHGFNRDYAVALQIACVWLDPEDTKENALLLNFFKDMPVNSPILGWWAAEKPMVTRGSEYGLPVLCTDWGTNFTVFGGMPRELKNVPRLPQAPTLENKIYVAVIMSDGDNVMFSQHRQRVLWDDPSRGKMPLTWTMTPSGYRDVLPAIANYYYRTATTNDSFIAGPSGACYTYPNFWPTDKLVEYSKKSAEYLPEVGIYSFTGWWNRKHTDLLMSEKMPELIGITSQDIGSGRYLINDGQTAVSELDVPYTLHTSSMSTKLANAVNQWEGKSPKFIAMQGFSFADDITPTNIYNALQPYLNDSRFEFVTMNEYFQLLKASVNQHKPPVQNSNLALNKTATASSERTVDVASNATDGNTSTWWGSANDTFPSSITVDMNTVESIDQVILKLNPTWGTRTQNITLQGSVDGTSYTEIIGSTDYTFSQGDGKVEMNFQSTSTRYLRLMIQSNDGDNKAQVSEIEIYE